VPRLLPIVDCWNILDDNLLACPRDHVESVFTMLRRQGRQIEFTGGLEARALEDYQVNLLASLRPRPSMFFAYDPGDGFETLESAARRLLAAGFSPRSHLMRAYVLIGYPKDTFTLAEARLQQMLAPFLDGRRSHAHRWRSIRAFRLSNRVEPPPAPLSWTPDFSSFRSRRAGRAEKMLSAEPKDCPKEEDRMQSNQIP
jgi:hypothetical protein